VNNKFFFPTGAFFR